MHHIDIRRWMAVLVLAGATGIAGCGDKTAPGPDDTPAGHGENAHAENESSSGHERHSAGETGHAHGASANRVTLNPRQLKQLDIEIGEARAGRADAIVEAPATVRFDADRVAHVGPRLQAKVVSVEADLGETVRAGDVLAVLDSVALGQAKAAYLTAAARYRTRQAAYARDRKLAEDQIVSDSDLAESRAAYQQARAERRAAQAELTLYGLDTDAIQAIDGAGDTPLSRLTLTAPRAGTIARRDLVAGQTVDTNETPIHIVDTTRMWLMIDAAEQALPRLSVGQGVRFSVRPLPDRVFDGKIDWIAPQLDDAARTVRIRAVVDNPDGALKAGMFARAHIDTAGQGGTLSASIALVPVDAVQKIEQRDGVFVPGEHDGAFVFTPVETGAENDGAVEIRRGIAPGDTVVTRGAFDLKAALTAGGRSAAHSH